MRQETDVNIDNRRFMLWNMLSEEEKESGRWVKLGDDEFARAERIPEDQRADALWEIFRRLKDDGVKLEDRMKEL